MPTKGLIGILIIVGILAVLVSCKTTSITIDRKQESQKAILDVLPSLEPAWSKNLKTLKIKQIDGVLNVNGNSQKVKGQLAMYRDSVIIISVIPALGYEVLRVICTPDSIIVINRPEKSYIATSLEKYRIAHRIPVGFNEIQAMIAGEIFYFKYGLPERTYLRTVVDTVQHKLFAIESFNGGERLCKQTIQFDAENYGPESIIILDYKDKLKINLTYKDYIFHENLPFPGKVSLSIIEKSNYVELQLKYGQVFYNEPLKVKFDAPSNYLRVDM